jgi:hypothetical protein
MSSVASVVSNRRLGSYTRSGTAYRSHLQRHAVQEESFPRSILLLGHLDLEAGTGSVQGRRYQTTLSKKPEVPNSQLHCG